MALQKYFKTHDVILKRNEAQEAKEKRSLQAR